MNFKTESGRSMVEMLGTLAIIGVLSIGGIAGYSYGMDKYRANETINDINMRGIDLVRQVAMEQTLSLSEWSTVSKVGYTISEANLSADGEAYFSVSGMSQRVCEMVYEGIQNNQTTVVEINESTNGNATDCQSENNTMTFFFITTTSENVVDLEKLCDNMTCPAGSSCTHGICMSEEAPHAGSDWKKCISNNTCGICEQCIDYGYNDSYCQTLNDGTNCGTGKICQKGQCIEDKACTDNTECSYNYYCGYLYDMNKGNMSNSKSCILAEFYKIPLSDGDSFYISAHKANPQDADAMCDAIGMKFIENFDDRPDVAAKLTRFTAFSRTQGCYKYQLYENELTCYPTSTAYEPGYIVCVKENKVYEGDIGKDEELSTVIETEIEIETSINTEETTTATEETTTTAPIEGCTSNSECNPNEYCALLTQYPVPEEPFPNGEKGECTPLDYKKHTITINGVDEVWYVSSQSVRNYWDAYHFCEKLGKTMVSLADLYSDTYFHINNYRADVLANALNFDSRVCILVSDKEGYVARLGSYRTGGSFYDTAGYALCYEGTLADLE